MARRVCKKCSRERLIEDFPFYDRTSGKRRYECKDCNTKRVESWHLEHYEDRLAKQREVYRRNPAAKWTPERRKRAAELARVRYEKVRNEVFDRHGGECVACGEPERMFLTIDHINNDGWSLRKGENGYRESGIGLYLDILRNGMRKDLEVLCFNCNFGKRRNGGKIIKDRRVK